MRQVAASLIYITPIIFVLLAIYGWYVVTRIAQYRAASDLYYSAIAMLEQIEKDGIEAWIHGPQGLDEYTELKLKTKITAVEQRFRLLRKHYDGADFTENIADLRRYLTMDNFPASRSTEIHRLVADMITRLLEENYAYINRSPLVPRWRHGNRLK